MSHEHSVFELTEGLNVLVGPNNCGKSAVVTALQILCYNDSSKYALRHEAKECSILVETDDGHSVRWSRKKSGSPWYEIDGQRYDRLGKNGIPDLLHEVLRLNRVTSEKDTFDVHFGEQRSPVFLLNEKPRQAADFFASSSDARHLLEMQSLHKQKVRDATNNLKQLKRESVELSASLKQLEPLDELLLEMEAAERIGKTLDEGEQASLHLTNLCRGLKQANREIRFREMKLARLATVPQPPQLIDEDQLEQLTSSISNTEKQVRRLELREKTLANLQEPPQLDNPKELTAIIRATRKAQTDQDCLAKKTSLLDKLPTPIQLEDTTDLLQLTNAIRSNTETQQKLRKESKNLTDEFQLVEQRIQEWTRQNPHCPTCGGEVTVEQLVSQGGQQHGDD